MCTRDPLEVLGLWPGANCYAMCYPRPLDRHPSVNMLHDSEDPKMIPLVGLEATFPMLS